MKKKNFIMMLSLVFGLILTSCTTRDSIEKKKTNIEDVNNINEIIEQSDVTVTMKDIADFLETKKEHYPFSDEFVERYQQTSGGYIENAKKAGLVVDKHLHEPNQKWHFFESWLYPSIEDNTLSWDESAKSRVYSKLLCPELLLWIYEACEVDPIKVRDAKVVAEQGKSSGTSVTTIAKNMRGIVSWTDLEDSILDFMNSDIEKYSVSVTQNCGFEVINLKEEYREGSEVSFTVNVINNSMQIDTVKVNDQKIEPVSGTTYKFVMPGNDVNISISLKEREKVPAESVSLSSKTLELFRNGKEKKISANPLPVDTTDSPIWSISEGTDIISITQNGNEVSVKPLKVGTAKIKVIYNSNVSEECVVKVNEPSSQTFVTEYTISYDLGTRVTAKQLTTNEDAFNTFELNEDGDGIISSVESIEYVYGGGNGGSSPNKWYSGDMLKIGTASIAGSLTLSLNAEATGLIITGYAHKSSCKVRVGDASSLDFTDSGTDNKTHQQACGNLMNIASLDTISNKQTTSVMFNFESTSEIKIQASNALYITSIEFVLED